MERWSACLNGRPTRCRVTLRTALARGITMIVGEFQIDRKATQRDHRTTAKEATSRDLKRWSEVIQEN